MATEPQSFSDSFTKFTGVLVTFILYRKFRHWQKNPEGKGLRPLPAASSGFPSLHSAGAALGQGACSGRWVMSSQVGPGAHSITLSLGSTQTRLSCGQVEISQVILDLCSVLM